MKFLKEIVEGKRKQELRQKWLYDWMCDAVSYTVEADLSQIKDLVSHWRDSGRLLVLLDGLDEVPESLRLEIVNKLDQFSSTPEGQRSRIVITSRTVGYIKIG